MLLFQTGEEPLGFAVVLPLCAQTSLERMEDYIHIYIHTHSSFRISDDLNLMPSEKAFIGNPKTNVG